MKNTDYTDKLDLLMKKLFLTEFDTSDKKTDYNDNTDIWGHPIEIVNSFHAATGIVFLLSIIVSTCFRIRYRRLDKCRDKHFNAWL